MISKKVLMAVFVACVFLIVGAVLLLPSDRQKKNIVNYSSAAKEKPIVQTRETLFDFGKVKVADVKEKDFEIKNVGSKTLDLFDITSSCGCTVGQVIYQGKTSRELGMHSQNDDVFNIFPNTKAIIKVTYRPFIMPVYGVVAREVYVSTNDPQTPKLVFQVKAYVE